MEFLHYQPTRIHFGPGKIEKIGEIARAYGTRCLLVTPEPIEVLKPLFTHVRELLEAEGITVSVYDKVQPNPLSSAVEEAVKKGFDHHVDFVVGLGGGSAIDTAKMVAYNAGCRTIDWDEFFTVRTGFQDDCFTHEGALPILAIPTTSGTGSQCTQAAVITNEETHQKTTVFRQQFFPSEAIIDPKLMATLPYGMSASTAFDAFCHLSESYMMKRLSCISEPMCITGMRMIVDTLPKLKEDARLEYREQLAAADTIAGICLANGGGTIPHFLGEILTSWNTRINHGCSLAVVYPKFIEEYFEDAEYHERLSAILQVIAPKISCTTKEQARSVVEDFLKRVDLQFTISDFQTSQEQYESMLKTVRQQTRFQETERLLSILKACY